MPLDVLDDDDDDDDSIIRPLASTVASQRPDGSTAPQSTERRPSGVDDDTVIRPEAFRTTAAVDDSIIHAKASTVLPDSTVSPALAILSDPAVREVMDFLRQNDSSPLNSDVMRSALDSLPVEDAMAYFIALAEANGSNVAAIAKNGGLVPGSPDAKLAGLTFILDQVLELPVVEGDRRTKLARQRGELQILEATAASGLAVATSKAELGVIDAKGQLAQSESRARVDEVDRQLKESRDLGGLDLQHKQAQNDFAVAQARVDAAAAVVVPAEQGLANRAATLTAKKLTRRQTLAERSFAWNSWGRAAVIALVVLTVISNLVCDTPGQEGYPILSWVNTLWDALYMPVRNGIMHSIDRIGD